MRKLTANFNVQLPAGGFLIYRQLTEELLYETRIADFEVEIDINPEFEQMRKLAQTYPKAAPEDEPYFSMSNVRISVTREEHVEPPPSVVINGVKTYEERIHYFKERQPEYREVAFEVLERAIQFFKYSLHNPQLISPPPYGKAFQNPSWTDETGREISKGYSVGVGTKLPVPGIFGVNRLTANEDSNLKHALENPIVAELHEELLSDAQTAIFQGNLRRAVLEMAIACEVSVKQAFFAENTIAGAAYAYLEDKRKVDVTVMELLHRVAEEAFGQSFKDFSPGAYEHIDYLFRCRNKIAHRGKAIYKDEKGKLQQADAKTLELWWSSVEVLLIWLSKQKQAV